MTILGKADNEQVLAKVYHATVNIGQSATETEFTIVSESLRVPFLHDHSEEDYSIKVGIGEDPAKGEQARKGAKRS
jgi:predicted aspartyl protease